MNITINGKNQKVGPSTTIADLLETMQLTGKRLAVEVNDEIVPRGNHTTHKLSDNDKIEVVHAIGGGSPD